MHLGLGRLALEVGVALLVAAVWLAPAPDPGPRVHPDLVRHLVSFDGLDDVSGVNFDEGGVLLRLAFSSGLWFICVEGSWNDSMV